MVSREVFIPASAFKWREFCFCCCVHVSNKNFCSWFLGKHSYPVIAFEQRECCWVLVKNGDFCSSFLWKQHPVTAVKRREYTVAVVSLSEMRISAVCIQENVHTQQLHSREENTLHWLSPKNYNFESTVVENLSFIFKYFQLERELSLIHIWRCRRWP